MVNVCGFHVNPDRQELFDKVAAMNRDYYDLRASLVFPPPRGFFRGTPGAFPGTNPAHGVCFTVTVTFYHRCDGKIKGAGRVIRKSLRKLGLSTFPFALQTQKLLCFLLFFSLHFL